VLDLANTITEQAIAAVEGKTGYLLRETMVDWGIPVIVAPGRVMPKQSEALMLRVTHNGIQQNN
jgi:hypothetical protein